MNSIRLEIRDQLDLERVPSDHTLFRCIRGSTQALPEDAVERRVGPEQVALIEELFAGQDLRDEALRPTVANRLKAWWQQVTEPWRTK